MTECPGCDREFEPPDPFCSSCVEAGVPEAYDRGRASVHRYCESARFKPGDIVVSMATKTAATVDRVHWVAIYEVTTKQVLQGAHEQLTGMLCGVNEYWLPEVMSEAIEAAQELGL